MECIQKMIVGALKNSGHTVALVDRELRIRWATGLHRKMVGAQVHAIWKGARVAQGQIRNLIRDLSNGNGCTAEGRASRKSRERMRIDFIPLRDASGEVEGFAVIRQIVGAAATGVSDGVAEIYELLFELNADEFSGLLAA
ncbi:hypothetical protein EBT23_02300 [bacterium]|nr:hypothetical protein [bacterium]